MHCMGAPAHLFDGQCPMHDARQVAKVGGTLLLDPSNEEEARREGQALLALLPASNELTQLRMEGCWGDADTRDAVELGIGACLQLRASMRDAVMKTEAEG